MKDMAARALNQARLAGATYADVRVITRRSEVISVKDGKVEAFARRTDEGFGVRVIASGAWGFASSNRLTGAEAARIAKLAVSIAKASARAKKADVQLSPLRAVQARYETPHAIRCIRDIEPKDPLRRAGEPR